MSDKTGKNHDKKSEKITGPHKRSKVKRAPLPLVLLFKALMGKRRRRIIRRIRRKRSGGYEEEIVEEEIPYGGGYPQMPIAAFPSTKELASGEMEQKGTEQGEMLPESFPVEEFGKYVLPMAYTIPIFKGMEDQQIVKKVYELYHIPEEFKEHEKESIREIYPLIPEDPKPGDHIMAWAYIHWDPKSKELVYEVIEPQLSDEEKEMLEKLKKLIEEKLDVLFIPKEIKKHEEYLRQKIHELVDLYGWDLDEETARKLEYYIIRDFVGYGKIEPLMRDKNIEDISCDGVGIPVFVFHRNPLYGQMRTNIVFDSKEELDSFVMKLAQRAGKSISVAQPLLDATLPDGSRLQATLGSDIARRGSNFTIRKFTKEPLTPIHLIENGTINSLGFAYLWLCVEYGMSILIAGTTASGKTTMLNAISLFIRPELKIVSIEDTAELQLPHPNWIPQVARTGLGAGSYGTVEMFDLLKAALRQRPDYIIVGEVRGKEASVMFQGMATGHPALATIHADNVQRVVDRLTTPPINLSPVLIENLDVIVFMERVKVGGRFLRRTKEIVEIKGVDVKNAKVIPNVVFEWIPSKDEFEFSGKSLVLEKIAKFRGVTYEEVYREMERRAFFLEYLRYKGVRRYDEFAMWIKTYYSDPEGVMQMVMRDVQSINEQVAVANSA